MAGLVRFDAPPGGDVVRVRMQDGTNVRVAHWRPKGAPRATIILLTGRSEFIEKYHEVVGELLSRDYLVWVCDWRGQGLSDRMLRNPHKGHIDDYGTYLDDLETALRLGLPRDAPSVRLVLAHSMGGHIALRQAASDPGWVRGMVLSAPMVDINLPGRTRWASQFLARSAVAIGLSGRYLPGSGDYGEKQVRFDGNLLTHDHRRFDNMVAWVQLNPDLALGGPTFGWLSASLTSISILQRREAAGSISTPVLIASAVEDTVVSNVAQNALCSDLPHATLVSIEGALHEVLMETDDKRQLFWSAFDGFADEVLC